MKEFNFSKLGRSVPVFASLAAQVGLVPSIIVVQLEFLTGMKKEVIKDGELKIVRNHINGFYKYLKRPSKNEKGEFPAQYRIGDSWCEWIGCTPDVFLTGFKKIGVAYASVKAFNDVCKLLTDPFAGKLYMSVIDHKTNLTHYYRNHGVADQFFSDFCAGVPVTVCLKKKGEKPVSGDGKDPILPETAKPPLPIETVKPPLPIETAKPPLPDSPITSPITSLITSLITTDITSYIYKEERERNETEETPSLKNIAESNSSQSQNPVLQAEASAKRPFGYVDPESHIWVENIRDENLAKNLVDKYGASAVQAAAVVAMIENGNTWASEVAKLLAHRKGKQRGDSIPEGKFSDFDQNDYRKGVAQDGSF